MRRLLISRLVRIFTVCLFNLFFIPIFETRSLSEFSCLSEYTRHYPTLQAISRMNKEYEEHKKEWKDKHELTVYDSLAVEYLPLDLASFKSTLQFVEAFKKSGGQLHILICNAGIGMAPYGECSFDTLLEISCHGSYI